MAGADISLIFDDCTDDSDEGFEQGDCSNGAAQEDASLPPLNRVQNYAYPGNIQSRQTLAPVARVVHLFRTAPEDILTTNLPKMMKVLSEESMLRADCLEQIPHIAAQAFECSSRVGALKNVVSEYLIPLVVRHLGSSDTAVDKAAHATLIQLIAQGYITKQQAEIQVCPSILALSKVESNLDVNTGAVTLMSKLAPLLGKDVTERVFLKRFSELCASHMFYVRKVCASHIGDFCAVVGKDAFEKILLPCYIALCNDDIWGVRKACAEVAMFVSSPCTPTVRRTVLAPVFAKLLQDECRWVRLLAFQTLGPFISTFADPTVTNLGYSNGGELVLQSGDGSEFMLDNSNRYYYDYQFEPMSDFDLSVYIRGVKQEKKELEVMMNPLLTEADVLPKYVELNQETQETEKQEEEDEKNVSKEVISEQQLVEVPVECVLKEEEVKEIVETVKNAVLSYRMEGETEQGFLGPRKDNEKNIAWKQWKKSYRKSSSPTMSSNSHIDFKMFTLLGELKETMGDGEQKRNSIELAKIDGEADTTVDAEQRETETCDSLNEEKKNESIMDTKKVNTVGDTSDGNEDDLHLYNEYNYWYITPYSIDLECNVKETENELLPVIPADNKIASHLERLYSAISLNDSLDETLSISSSINTESENKLDSIVNRCTELESKSLANNEPKQNIVPQDLIDHFISMTDPNLALNIDNEMTFHCAYSLPAVAMTLGSSNWHLLKNTVDSLASDMQYKVRRTVASSLHELALILGPEIATENLTPLFDGFLKDLDEVRVGVLKHLAHFLKLINPAKRSAYLPRLQEFLQTDNEWNWRFRQVLAKQLLLAVPLFKPNEAAKHIGSVAEELMCDKVAAVRHMAILLITEIIRYASEEPSFYFLLVKLAEKFAHSKMWKRRQTFALLCTELMVQKAISPEIFASDVMPHLLDLSWDPVANVRLVVARCLAKNVMANEYFSDRNGEHFDCLETVLRRLQADKDRDVRQSAQVENLSLS